MHMCISGLSVLFLSSVHLFQVKHYKTLITVASRCNVKLDNVPSILFLLIMIPLPFKVLCDSI